MTQGQFHLLANESPLREKFQTDLKEGSETINGKEEISRITADQSVESSQLSIRPVMCRKKRLISQMKDEPTPNENIADNTSWIYELTRRCPFCTVL